MIEPVTFADEALPADLKCQILSAHRIAWPEGYVGKNRLRDRIQPPRFHPTHFLLVEQGILLVEQGILLGYVGVTRKRLEHAGETSTTYGLSGVFTSPAFRREGHGRRLVDAATARIRHSDADVGLFTCAPRLTGFYAAAGWEPIASAVLLVGPRRAPRPSPERTMMGFFTAKGTRGRAAFASAPIVFADDPW